MCVGVDTNIVILIVIVVGVNSVFVDWQVSGTGCFSAAVRMSGEDAPSLPICGSGILGEQRRGVRTQISHPAHRTKSEGPPPAYTREETKT